MMTTNATHTNSQTNDVQLMSTTKATTDANPHANSKQFYVGIFLALLSSLFIGSSFILKKKGLLKLTNCRGALRAGTGGFGYLREVQWWAGLLTMAFGEFCNFAAYGFAPASVVTPLGALSVLVSALMAVRFLDEKLNRLGKIGCLLTVSGSIVIIIHAPKETEVNSLLEFAHRVGAPEFLFFSFLIFAVTLSFIIHYGPRYGAKYIHVYIIICSLLGAFTVTACKGLGTGLKEIFTGQYTFSVWLTFLCAMMILVCVLTQMVYLNKALDLFSTPLVTTTYYVLFTTCVLITSGILFREWRVLTVTDITACLVGFCITTCGLILINYLKTNTLSNDLQLEDVNDDSFFSFLTLNSQIPSPSVKNPNPLLNKSYVNLLLDGDDLPSTTNSLNEQRRPMLLIDEYDLRT